MPDGASSSELWLLRTYFGEDDDAIWTSLTESARSTRSAVPGAELVVSSDRTQCQQRIRRVVARLATRAEANDGLYVALARIDRCSPSTVRRFRATPNAYPRLE